MEGKSPWIKRCRVRLNTQVRIMPVKNGGTAISSWFTALPMPRTVLFSTPAANRPTGRAMTTMRKKLIKLRARVTLSLGPSSSPTGVLYL